MSRSPSGTAVFTLAIVAALLRPAPGQGPAAASKLTFRELEHDFGRIHDAATVEWRFGYTNTSAAPVTIVDVHTSCGCTKTRLEQKTCQPGASGELVVSFNPANRQGKEKKTVAVRTDEPGEPRTQLVILADVIPRIGVDPPSVQLGEVRFDAVAAARLERPITITSRVPAFAIKSATIDDVRFTLTALPPAEGEADGDKVTRYVYQVALPGNVPIGRLQANVRIVTNDALKPEIAIPVLVDAVGDLRISPSPVTIQMMPGEPVDAVVTVTAVAGKPFRILAASVAGCDKMTMTAEVDAAPIKNGAGWRVHLRGTAPAGGTSVSGTLRLQTDVPQQPDIPIPFTGFVFKVRQ